MLNAHRFPIEDIARAYDLRSALYDLSVARSEFPYHLAAIESIEFRPGMKLLEVATGPGRALREILDRMPDGAVASGIDVSPNMIKRTRRRLIEAGHEGVELLVGDCRHLPWPDEHFDTLYNGYMMDLIPDADIPAVLAEFRRVLKPGGQLVMINMSRDSGRANHLDVLYRMLPKKLALYLMGNCRPVMLAHPTRNAGFADVVRTYLSGKHPSEIVTARKR